MKSALGLITLLGVTLSLFSCKKTINCDTPVIKKVVFFTSESTYPVEDTSYTLQKFRKDSKFGQLSDAFPEQPLTKELYNRSLDLPEHGAETYDYDWVIVLKPSGRIYQISDVSSAGETSTTHHCTTTVTYKVNDSTYTVPGNPYSPTPYFTSDIQIQYW